MSVTGAVRLRSIVLPLLVAVVLVSGAMLGSVRPVSAQGTGGAIGIRLSDEPETPDGDARARQYIVEHVAPGTTVTRQVEVVNSTAGQQSIALYPGPATIVDGTFAFGDRDARSDLTAWTTVSPTEVRTGPGDSEDVTVTIAVPPEAQAGERYGVVWAEVSSPPDASGVVAVNRVGVRMYLSVGPGGAPPTEFAIGPLEARRGDDGAPTVAAAVTNLGGVAVDLTGELMLRDGPASLAAGPFPAVAAVTLGPGQAGEVLFELDRALPAGPWTADLVLRSGITERTATAQLTFPDAPAVDPAASSSSSSPAWVLLALGAVAAVGVVAGVVAFRRRTPRG